ncbi:MAG TPA: NAD(P)-dependent oxidoreductase [Gemmatimonadales bacterium]|nr:NAD(P)-dependent oxidoreductase [Gemmatimonadales bacterium]
MKIVVIGATGNIGRRVIHEALSRGHEVTGIVRDPAAVQAPDSRVRLVKADATKAEEVARAVKGADAVVSAISPRRNARGLPAPSLQINARALIKGLRDAQVKRVLYVGGASSLEVAPGQALADQPDFPEAYKAEAREGREALAVWRNEGDALDWTYLSPAVEIGPGQRTGNYRTTGDAVLLDSAGKSFISFEDYAVAVLDELEHPRNVARRFGVAY